MRGIVILAAVLASGCDRSPAPVEANAAPDTLAQIANELPPVSEATWRDASTLECRPATKDICGPGGCERQPALVWLRWTPATRSYQRCDRNGCDSYTANVAYSGAYAVIELPGRSTIMKLTGRNAYVEIASQMDGVLIYRGQCQPVTGEAR